MPEEISEELVEEDDLSSSDVEVDIYDYKKDLKEYILPDNEDEIRQLMNDENITIDRIIPNNNKILIFYTYQYLADEEEIKKRWINAQLKDKERELLDRDYEENEYSEKIERLKG